MKYKNLKLKKYRSKLDIKKILKIVAILGIFALLFREGLGEFSKLTESGVLRQVKKAGSSEYDLGLGDVGSKHFKISTPKDWPKYENDSLAFSYPQYFSSDDSKFSDVNKIRLVKNDKRTTDLGLTIESDVSIRADEGNMLPAAGLHKQAFLRDWKMSAGVSNITHLTRYSLNNRSVYHMAYRVDTNNYNPLMPIPFSNHWVFIQVDNRYYVLSATNIDLSNEDQFVEDLLAIAASVENKGELQEPEHQLPLGLRKPKNEEEQLQLGSDLLEFTKDTITFGDPEAEIMMIAFVSTLSAENYPAIIALSGYTSSHERVGLRFEIIPVVDSNLNQYSYSDAQLHCVLLKTSLNNLIEISGQISDPAEIPVVDPNSVKSCLSNPGLPSQIHTKSTKATDFGVTDTPIVTVLYKGAWQGDYYGWEEIEELLEGLNAVHSSKKS